jgi:hypothetical protein
MAPHWKCGSRQRVAGSNPALSATRRSVTQGPRPDGPRRAGGMPPRRQQPSGTPARADPTPVRCHRNSVTPAVLRATVRGRPRPWAPAARFAVHCACRARRGTSGALYLQSAPAGLNSLPRSPSSNADASSDVEGRVPRSGEPRTVSGPEGSSTKRSSSGAAERPGPSRSRWRARGRSGRRRVHGNLTRPRAHAGTW